MDPPAAALRHLLPSPSKRVAIGFALLAAITVVSTLWFWVVEGFGFVEAVYQTVMTLTTVGFEEVRPFGTSARIFATLLMIAGVGVALFTLVAAVEELFEHQLHQFGRRRMDRRIEALARHVIVCGYGRVGERVAELLGAGGRVVVVDRDAERCEQARLEGYLTVRGDSTDDAVLLAAGLERASTVVVSLASDADAISTVLSARVLQPNVRIVARANAKSSEAKLVRAGVDRVVNPLLHGAERLAAFAEQPAVADFLDVVVHDRGLEYRLEEFTIPADARSAGRTLAEHRVREETGALVLALRQPDGTFLSNPGPDTPLEAGVTVIAIGTDDQLMRVAALVGAPVPHGDGR